MFVTVSGRDYTTWSQWRRALLVSKTLWNKRKEGNYSYTFISRTHYYWGMITLWVCHLFEEWQILKQKFSLLVLRTFLEMRFTLKNGVLVFETYQKIWEILIYKGKITISPRRRNIFRVALNKKGGKYFHIRAMSLESISGPLNPCPAEYIKMPHPFLIFSQLNYLIQVVDINSNT